MYNIEIYNIFFLNIKDISIYFLEIFKKNMKAQPFAT